MHPAKSANVHSLPAAERYDYFVRKVADFEKVWGLFSNGWALAEDTDGRKVFPFWPEEAFAESCADGSWAGYQPRAIPLDEFMRKWLPGMANDAILVGVFPTSAEKGIVVKSLQLEADLARELQEYE